MNIKLIDNPVRLADFLNDRQNTGNIVDPGEHYRIKPDALYLGLYEGVMLAGVHEGRPFWLGVIDHAETAKHRFGTSFQQSYPDFRRHETQAPRRTPRVRAAQPPRVSTKGRRRPILGPVRKLYSEVDNGNPCSASRGICAGRRAFGWWTAGRLCA